MLKILIKHVAVFLICSIISFCLFNFFIGYYNYITRNINTSIFSAIGLWLFLSFLMYIIIIVLIDKRIYKIHIDILAVSFFLLILILSFLRGIARYSGLNLNPLTIVHDMRGYFKHTLLILIANILVYFPIGMYVKYRFKLSFLKLFLIFIYITLIEITQYVSYRGICDINDVISNTVGFMLGAVFYQKLLRKLKFAKSDGGYKSVNK